MMSLLPILLGFPIKSTDLAIVLNKVNLRLNLLLWLNYSIKDNAASCSFYYSIKIILSNKNWIKHIVFMRDLITHYSDLIGSSSITQKAEFDENEYATLLSVDTQW